MMKQGGRLLLGGLLVVFVLFPAPSGAEFLGFAADTSGDLHPAECNGRKSPIPKAYATAMNGATLHLDGKLDEAVWEKAPAATGFVVWDPDRGAIPSEETVFKVLYDDDAVYFGVACLEKDTSKITSHLARRDRFSNSDLVSVYIDPYHDKTTGYNFKVNPEGVQMDSYMYNDGDRDDDWDAVWQAETHRDAQGWYVEIRIPFSSIRYRPADEMTWGLQVYRYMHGRGEDTSWVTWDRNTRGFISRFGELTGLRGVHPPRQIEVTPYFVQRATDPSVAGPGDELDNVQNLGADLKYGVTADLTMNATVQPDFGQVEADPAVLNLSPFETQFQEKRPFFIEGNRFFEHRAFNLFYSRRIGTGDENTRIRYAGKLTGKTPGGFSLAALVASTDVAGSGQAHNVFKSGDLLTRYFVGRFGKEFKDGAHRINFMQTATLRTASRDDLSDPTGASADRSSREAYTSGLDFNLNFKNREYEIVGSAVGSVIDPEPTALDPTAGRNKKYGTGGHLEVRRLGGKLRASTWGRWEHDKLELNDLGFLSAPDESEIGLWVGRPYNPEGKSKLMNRGELNLNAWKGWLYAGRAGRDSSGAVAWSYGPGHRSRSGGNINGWGQFKNFWEGWFGIEVMPEGTQRYETRGGPLISEPTTFGGWIGGSTDTRKNLSFNTEGSHYRDTSRNHSTNLRVTTKWNQSSAFNHQVSLGFNYRVDDTQYLETVDLSERPGGQGIGGFSYLFGKIHQRTADVTLRTSVLFSRNQSLDLYAQPFISVGDYANAVELGRADTYDLIPYAEPGYRVENNDFTYTSVNVNAVYRWEYRPGSALFLVWTHGREGYADRASSASPQRFDNPLAAGDLFRNEPVNVLLAKVSYWFAL